MEGSSGRTLGSVLSAGYEARGTFFEIPAIDHLLGQLERTPLCLGTGLVPLAYDSPGSPGIRRSTSTPGLLHSNYGHPSSEVVNAGAGLDSIGVVKDLSHL